MASHEAEQPLIERVDAEPKFGDGLITNLNPTPRNVRGGGRQSTVHGNTVNLPARLEVLSKEYGTSVPLSATTAKALPEREELVVVGDVAVRAWSIRSSLSMRASRVPEEATLDSVQEQKMNLCKLVDRMEYLLFALILLPTLLVIGAAIVSLANM